MITVHKYPLSTRDETTVTVPTGHRFVHAAMQDGTITLWAVVDTESTPTWVSVRVAGTGYSMPWIKAYDYLGTVHDDKFVWHIFVEAHPHDNKPKSIDV